MSNEFLYYEYGEPVYADDLRRRELDEARAELQRFREREPLVRQLKP